MTGTNLNNSGGEITITMQNLDSFTHPSNSYLPRKRRLTKTDGSAYTDADLVSLSNNAMMHLFKSIQYRISGQVIENILRLGQATTMLGLLKYPDDFSKSQGLNLYWYKDTTTLVGEENVEWNIRKKYIIDNSDPKGSLSFRILLKHIFGFCVDNDKVVYGMTQTLILARNDDNDAIFRANTAADDRVTLDRVSWFIPFVKPGLKEENELYKIIQRKDKLVVGYRMIQCESTAVPQAATFSWTLSVKTSPEVPCFIIDGSQTNKSGSQRQNPSIFNHVGVTNIYVNLSNTSYPRNAYKLPLPRL